MKEFSTSIPPYLPNPLAEIQAVQRELYDSVAGLSAQFLGMNTLLSSLVATHPDPKALAENFLDQMDRLGDLPRTAHDEKFFPVFQRWRDLVTAAAHRK